MLASYHFSCPGCAMRKVATWAQESVRNVQFLTSKLLHVASVNDKTLWNYSNHSLCQCWKGSSLDQSCISGTQWANEQLDWHQQIFNYIQISDIFHQGKMIGSSTLDRRRTTKTEVVLVNRLAVCQLMVFEARHADTFRPPRTSHVNVCWHCTSYSQSICTFLPLCFLRFFTRILSWSLGFGIVFFKLFVLSFLLSLFVFCFWIFGWCFICHTTGVESSPLAGTPLALCLTLVPHLAVRPDKGLTQMPSFNAKIDRTGANKKCHVWSVKEYFVYALPRHPSFLQQLSRCLRPPRLRAGASHTRIWSSSSSSGVSPMPSGRRSALPAPGVLAAPGVPARRGRCTSSWPRPGLGIGLCHIFPVTACEQKRWPHAVILRLGCQYLGCVGCLGLLGLTSGLLGTWSHLFIWPYPAFLSRWCPGPFRFPSFFDLFSLALESQTPGRVTSKTIIPVPWFISIEGWSAMLRTQFPVVLSQSCLGSLWQRTGGGGAWRRTVILLSFAFLLFLKLLLQFLPKTDNTC